MAAAGGVAGDAVLQRQTRRQQGAAGRRASPGRDAVGVGHADPSDDLGRQGKLDHAPDIVLGMGQPQRLDIDELRPCEAVRTRDSLDLQQAGQARELVHREAMPRRHFGAEGGVVDDRRRA
jgi:hypothetical protein